GHLGNRSDEAVIDGWNADFGKAGRDLPRFLTAMVGSDGFRFVSPPPSQGGQAADAKPAPGSGPTTDPTTPTTPPGTTPPPTNLAALCQSYCACMSKGACGGSLSGDCMGSCMKDGNNWALGCRLDKCQIAQHDYSDQITGD